MTAKSEKWQNSQTNKQSFWLLKQVIEKPKAFDFNVLRFIKLKLKLNQKW